ncbi:MAG: excinuclease ABC subunit UvrC [Magnetococcales bacterium]|nr:excinuclease ABC subunit UvrC [Magnetococcales bacterium]
MDRANRADHLGTGGAVASEMTGNGGGMPEGPWLPALPEAASSLPEAPGVYRFLDATGAVLYVGKAKSLKKRVTSYFHTQLSPRIRVMLSKATDLAIAVTTTEQEALILEATLIRRLQPPYNVLLKDDKSHPWLVLTMDHPFPRLLLHRGARLAGARHFGPYPSVQAVRATLKQMRVLFPLRQCEDRLFAGRTRPCLQFQIKRCHAPCMGMIGQEEYALRVRDAAWFLEGRDRQLTGEWRKEMWEAAAQRRFEDAARLRDCIEAVEKVREQGRANLEEDADLDIVAATTSEGPTAIQLFFVRNGINLGNQAHFPENTEDLSPAETLETFLAQYYVRGEEHAPPPPEILVNLDLPDGAWLMAALRRLRGGVVRVRVPRRGERKRLLDMAVVNAETAKLRRMSGRRANRRLLEELAERLVLPRVPERIEACDVSHFQDEAPVASLVVFGEEGMRKREYRRFSIKDPAAVDDTSRMAEVIARRFRVGEGESSLPWPDLLLLDGGKGQLQAVLHVARQQGIDGVFFCAMAKGEERDAGKEILYLPGRAEPVILPDRSPLRFLLQNIRDEAHRFAVTYHRGRRDHARLRSLLDDIPGVGPARKRALLRRFGSPRAVREARIEDVAATPGISTDLAALIVAFLRDDPETS